MGLQILLAIQAGAPRGITDIRLRERGTKKVHIFTGERKQAKKPCQCTGLDACNGTEKPEEL
jgi:hypothetical protein